jgi:hypothetical protein
MAKRVSRIADAALDRELNNIINELNNTTAGTTSWGNILSKPSTFPPSAHLHGADEITTDSTHRFVTDTQIATWSSAPGGHPALALGASPNGLSLDTTNQILQLGLASSSQTGALSSTDWNTFNSKEGELTFNPPLTRSVDTIGLNYNTTNLKLTSSALNTIQDINTGASPAFVQLTLSSPATGASHAVRADRTLTMTGTTNRVSITGGTQDLTGNRTWTFTLPQDIHTAANPTFNNLSLTGYADAVGGYKVNTITVVDSSRNFTGVNITLSGLIDQNGAGVNTFAGDLSSDSYLPGYLGLGFKLWRDAAGANGELDNLVIRNSLRTHIFQKDIVRATNGYLFISDASEIVAETTTADANKYIYCKENVFQVGDLLWYKDVDDAGGTITGIKLSISAVGGSVTLPQGDKTGYRFTYTTSNSGTFKAGGTIVRIGSTVAGRQGSIYFDASSAEAPFMDIYDGVASLSDFQSIDKVVLRAGKLSGITDPVLGALSGYGIYTNRGFFTSDVVIGGRSLGILQGQTALFHFDTNLQDSLNGIKPSYSGTYNETDYGLINSSDNSLVCTKASGKFGGGVAVEDGTTNTGLNVFFASATNWSNYSDGSAAGTRTFNKANTGFPASTCLNLVKTDGGSGNWGVFQFVASWTNNSYAYSYYYKINSRSSGAILKLVNGDQSVIASVNLSTVQMGVWLRLSGTSSSATGGKYIEISGANADVDVTCFQAEAKTYATSFVNGSRAYGSLQFVNDIALNRTYQFYFKYQGVNTQSTRIFHCYNSTSQRIGLVISGSYAIDVEVNGYFGTGYNLNNLGGVNFVNQWVLCQIDITATTVDFYLNGMLVSSRTHSGVLPTANVYLGSALANTLTSVIYDEFTVFGRNLTANERERIKGSNQPFSESLQLTRIDGSQIVTGLIKSQNWESLVEGTLIDLNKGYFELNNGTTNVFKFDSSTGAAKISTFDFTPVLLKNTTLGINIGDYTGETITNGVWLGNRTISSVNYRELILQGTSKSIRFANTSAGDTYGIIMNSSYSLALGDLTPFTLTGFGLAAYQTGTPANLYFKLATDGNKIAAFSFDADKINVGTDFVLDATNKKWYFNNKSTYASTNNGIFMGLDGGAYKINIGSSTKYFRYDGSNLEATGATITGGILQTGPSGERIVISGADTTISFYPDPGISTNAIHLVSDTYGSYPALSVLNDGIRATLFVKTTGDVNSYIAMASDYQYSTIFLTAASDRSKIVELNATSANGGEIIINDKKVLGPRRTGWAAATGTASRATFDTATVTVSQLAQRVKAIEDDLIAHGMIGT